MSVVAGNLPAHLGGRFDPHRVRGARAGRAGARPAITVAMGEERGEKGGGGR